MAFFVVAAVITVIAGTYNLGLSTETKRALENLFKAEVTAIRANPDE